MSCACCIYCYSVWLPALYMAAWLLHIWQGNKTVSVLVATQILSEVTRLQKGVLHCRELQVLSALRTCLRLSPAGHVSHMACISAWHLAA